MDINARMQEYVSFNMANMIKYLRKKILIYNKNILSIYDKEDKIYLFCLVLLFHCKSI